MNKAPRKVWYIINIDIIVVLYYVERRYFEFFVFLELNWNPIETTYLNIITIMSISWTIF